MCCQCKKPGHWAHSCLEGLDMHYLSTNKQDVLIMELLATKDAVSVPSLESIDRALKDIGNSTCQRIFSTVVD